MWHIIILFPIAGIVIFWLLPAAIAIPVYLAVVLVSGLMYWALFSSMRRKPKTGKEGLVGATGRVASVLGAGERAQYVIEALGELWKANSPDELRPGQAVRVSELDGLTLTVRRVDMGSNKGPAEERTPRAETK